MTSPQPINAQHWRDIREECTRRTSSECRYPWCACKPDIPALERKDARQ